MNQDNKSNSMKERISALEKMIATSKVKEEHSPKIKTDLTRWEKERLDKQEKITKKLIEEPDAKSPVKVDYVKDAKTSIAKDQVKKIASDKFNNKPQRGI